ncbi:uncharacterized protein [Temnothorax longispinosus]|uniref:uncharacterized protein n=1 Tax=Temnothorax longispinosus TaxID=300112 RepID=UPI003A99DDEF
MSKMILDQEINYDRLVNGLQITKDRSQFTKYKNQKIQRAQNYLSTGIYSLMDFLRLFEKDNLHKQHKIALLTDDDNEMEINDLYKEETLSSVSNADIQNSNRIVNEHSLNTIFDNDLNGPAVSNADDQNTSQTVNEHSLNTIFDNDLNGPAVSNADDQNTSQTVNEHSLNTMFDNNSNGCPADITIVQNVNQNTYSCIETMRHNNSTKKEYQQCKVIIKKIDSQQTIQKQKRTPLSTLSTNILPTKRQKKRPFCNCCKA